MTIPELEQRLNDPQFLNPENGDLFYNVFIYQYPADQEYTIREQIQLFRENLRRPTTQVEPIMINLYEQYLAYLDQKRFLKNPSMLRYLLDKEENNPADAPSVKNIVQRNAESEQFIDYLHQQIENAIHNSQNQLSTPYIFVYGIGSMYPWFRVNQFLTSYERYNETSKYKIIVFYPGRQDGNTFRLFGFLPDSHTYKANLLLNE